MFDMWGTLGPNPNFVMEPGASADRARRRRQSRAGQRGLVTLCARRPRGSAARGHIVPGARHGFDIFTEIVAPRETRFDRFVAFFFEHVAIVPEVPPPAVSASSSVAEFAFILCLVLTSRTLIRLCDPDLR